MISVIIPVYNVETYLSRCLDSILENTYKDLEIICVNDGSTDNSYEILKKYKQIDPRVIVIDKANGGISSARNSGLREASGDYVSFIDPDDWVHLRYFEYLLKAITEFDADISSCKYIRVKDNDALFDTAYTVALVTVPELAKFKVKLRPQVWGNLYKREIITGLFFDEKEKIEDTEYIFRLLLKNPALKVAMLDSILYAYYIRGDSLSNRISETDILKVSEKYVGLINSTDSKDTNAIIADSAFKGALIARFAFLALGDKNKVKRCNLVIKEALKYRFNLQYIILALFPPVYRLIMVRIDPTLKKYEKLLKQSLYNQEKL